MDPDELVVGNFYYHKHKLYKLVAVTDEGYVFQCSGKKDKLVLTADQVREEGSLKPYKGMISVPVNWVSASGDFGEA